MTHHVNLDTLVLDSGAHISRDDGVCLLEAVAYFAGEGHTDAPACVSIVLRTFGTRLNDVLPDGKRQALKPLIPQLVGTAGDGLDEARSYMALDWLIRTWTPAWLDLAGLTAEATALRDLRRIVDLVAAQEAGPVVRAGREKARAVRDAARDAAEGGAWDAAWVAARDAARAAAWAAAWDAAGWPAAARHGTVAAGDAARAGALDAAEAAARDGGRAALRPTVDQLQQSAIDLYTAMIQPRGEQL